MTAAVALLGTSVALLAVLVGVLLGLAGSAAQRPHATRSRIARYGALVATLALALTLLALVALPP